jgi:hypothetical protein
VEASLAPYAGSYSDFPWDGETIFFSWGGELASASVPSMNPIRDMDRYKKTGPHQFRRIRKDDTLAETITFEIGADGRATGVRVHSNVWPRLE